MRAFIVTTEYQLINAIKIINSEGLHKESDIYLLEKDDRLSSKINIEYLKGRVKGVFIKKYKTYNSSVIKLIFVIMNLLLYRFDGKRKKYNYIYIAGTEVYSKVLAYSMFKKRGNLFYIEDGIGSYIDVVNKETKAIKDIPFKIIYGKDPLKNCKGIYVYEPKCIIVNSYNVPIIRINRYENKNKNNISLTASFFEEPYYYDKSVIFFEAWFVAETEYDYQDYLIEKIAEVIGKENICIKKHPNDEKMKDRLSELEYIKTKSNFEVSNSFQDMNSKILIAAISSACITPKLINDQEPIIIFLYKLFEEKFSLWCNVDEPILRLLDLYKDKRRILIPKNEEELVSGLYQLKETFF